MKTDPMPSTLLTLSTTIALLEQFLISLSPGSRQEDPPSAEDAPSPLLLLSASAKTLKAQVTKLSLLAVTSPFTPNAVATCLQPLNESILTSLVTATFLTTPQIFTETFSNECGCLTRATLREALALTKLVEARSKESDPKREISDARKKDITEATGRVWAQCDEVVSFSENGLPGFVVNKAKQWLDLMNDAVKELSEWDPEDEFDEDDVFGDTHSGDEASDQREEINTESSADRATISAGIKDQALKVLSRIPQSVHVVVKQRLEKLRTSSAHILSPQTRKTLEKTVKLVRDVSELIDESAEGMYLGNLELCLKKAGEARAQTIEIVQLVQRPFEELSHQNPHADTQEDKYINRALEWIKQVDPQSIRTPQANSKAD